MNFSRASGILLHPTSLPGRFGIGDLGKAAYAFADFLKSTGQKRWQMLPLSPPGYGNSPYQSLSAFAGNPLLIDLEQVAREGFLNSNDLKQAPLFPSHRVDFDSVTRFKTSLLKKSFENFTRKTASPQFEKFCRTNAWWLDIYALFMAVKEAHGQRAWNTWEESIRQRQPEAVKRWAKKLSRERQYYRYEQYLFSRQWLELKKYCNQNGILIIGDIPIFVALDSDTVWSHPELFHLNEEGKPTMLSGVPPDYFSRTGQLWGNPLYRWDKMADDGYNWWIERFRMICTKVDIVRLDHFRGFEKYWVVPGNATNAINGEWITGPGIGFFQAVQKVLGELPIIAEDLGYITPGVEALRDKLGFPGMKVLQFAFGTDPKADDYKPHNYSRNCVVYTGTHDNDTAMGWFENLDTGSTLGNQARAREKELALKYVGTDGYEFNWDFIRLALMSVADTAIIPLQDILGLGSEARMNIPGTPTGNWGWRFTADRLTPEISDRLAEITGLYGR